MRKLLIVLALALPVGLGGCAALDPNGKSIFRGGSSFTASIDNPVTPKRLYQVEQGLIAVTEGLLVYKRSCIRQVIDQSCRGVIAQIQVYTRQVRQLLPRLRAFVRANDQVNAIKVYNEVQGIVADINSKRAAAGVP